MTMPAGSLLATVAGEEMVLLGERAMYWPARETLLVADPHFGKAAAFRFAGLFVPPGTTAAALSRLSRLVVETEATRIVFLGDFLHAAEGRTAQMFAGVAAWRRSHAAIGMTLVRGNHDRRAGDPPGELGFEVVDYLDEGPFRLAHLPVGQEDRYVLAGHVHPCVTVRGPALERERLPCFWIRRGMGVLPSFGEFTGCAEVLPVEGDRVWVVAGGEVVRV